MTGLTDNKHQFQYHWTFSCSTKAVTANFGIKISPAKTPFCRNQSTSFALADNEGKDDFKPTCLSLTAAQRTFWVVVSSIAISKCQWFPTSPFLLSGMKSESSDWWVTRPTRAWKGFKNNRGHVIAKRALATQS